MCPENQIALLNKNLFLWELAELRDDELQYKIQTEIAKIDPLLSRLIYTLFRQNIEGFKLDVDEMKELVIDPIV